MSGLFLPWIVVCLRFHVWCCCLVYVLLCYFDVAILCLFFFYLRTCIYWS